MKPIERILIPTDFSPTANNALLYALDFAEALKAKVYILHACRIPSAATSAYPVGYYEAVNMKELKEEAEDRMEKLRRDFLYAPKVDYECITQLGPAVDIIGRTAEEKEVDLLIMGTRQADGAKTWFGSVTTDTVQQSKIPVLAVPEEARFVRLQNLVLATTLTKLTHLTGLDMLRGIARAFGASINVLHIHPEHQDYTKEQTKYQAALDHYLEGIFHRFYTISNNDVNEGIQQHLDQHEADMIVMLPRQHGLLEQVLHASKTRYMIFHTHKPLLAVKE